MVLSNFKYTFNRNTFSYEEENLVPKRKWEYFCFRQNGVFTDQVSNLHGKLKNGHFPIHVVHRVTSIVKLQLLILLEEAYKQISAMS